MDERRFGYALAMVLVVAGLTIFGIGSATYAAELAEERACRAANDGLAELQCMNFGGIGFMFATAWGLGLAGAGALVAALTRHLVRGPSTREGSA